MTKHFKTRRYLLIPMILVSLAACESLRPGDQLLPADDVKPGPGLFSGESGEIHLKTKSEPMTNQGIEAVRMTDGLSVKLTSAELDEKIKQLEKQKKALEALKQELDKKLEE